MEVHMKKPFLIPLLLIACVGILQPIIAKSTEDKIKDVIDSVADSLKEGVDAFGDDLASIQSFLENYPWKGVIQDRATSGPITLTKLRLNGHSRVAAVRPGASIEGVVEQFLDPNIASSCKVYRAVIGFKDIGPQTSIGTTIGFNAGASLETFTLHAPLEPGFYEVRFGVADSFFYQNAWPDEEGDQPDASTTIGVIYVKE